jgi:hypothetical protein
MAVTKVLARGWKFEVYDTDTLLYVEVTGINTFTFTRGKNDADTTDFDSEGYEEHMAASRNFEITGEGFYKEDLSTGDRDLGQEIMEDYAELVGEDSLRQFRMTSPGGTEKEFNASVNIGDVGGGNDDPTSWGFTLTVSGKLEII